jgi:hypothetical protein
VEGEWCFFLGAWLVVSPVFSTGFPALIHTSLTDTALELKLVGPKVISKEIIISFEVYSYCNYTTE